MPMDTKSRQVGFKERADFGVSKHFHVFGIAIEIHGRITASGERVFLLKSRNTWPFHDTS